MRFPAHIYFNRIQSCEEHCRNTAYYASISLSKIGLSQIGYVAGLLHDCGKFSEEFSNYIKLSAAGENVRRGSVIHSFAGISCIFSMFHRDIISKTEQYICNLTSELIAAAIGCHHGLFDFLSETGSNGFAYRLEKQPEYDAQAMTNFIEYCCGGNELTERFERCVVEVKSKLELFGKLAKSPDEYLFYEGMLARILISAVIDGDRLDTSCFASGIKRLSVITDEERVNVWQNCIYNLNNRLDAFPSDTEIQKARRSISDQCAAFAEKTGGIYRLNVPTGGAKTLASIRYALEHSVRFRKSRIFYIAPLITIIEQNAKAIRDAVGAEYVLEYHSNVILEESKIQDSEHLASRNAIIRSVLDENWDHPIIVTTLVQFLNSLFSDSTDSIRKMNKLADSVIIIDEIQTVPIRMLSLFNLAVNFLAKICGVTAILCSATQPCLEQAVHSLQISQESMINSYTQIQLREIFKRNEIIDAGSMLFSELPKFIAEKAQFHDSILVICNKKAQAVGLWSDMRSMGYDCIMLSSAMCIAHRRIALDKIKKRLQNKERIICISTQVIEAGVDISFEAVIRLTAGMDSVIQAAGRCNRSGEYGKDCPVYMITCTDENLSMLREIQLAKSASEELLTEFRKDKGKYNNSLSSDASISYYYRRLYHNYCERASKGMDYPVKDHPTLYSLLSDNIMCPVKDDQRYVLRQAMKTAGSLFSALDSQTISILVPYEGGKEVITELSMSECIVDLDKAKAALGRAKSFMVSVFEHELRKLQEQDALISLCDGLVMAVKEGYYSDNTGLLTDKSEKREEEDCSTLIL